MTSRDCRLAEFYARLLRKMHEDLLEALYRTPFTVSSRPYLERAARLARAGYTAALEALEECSGRQG
ncbi:MAG: hypothetical protein GXO15_05145 [Crenarchaeota archaeon]|nr:hypothetical protein [Thermoproteota archaeon]